MPTHGRFRPHIPKGKRERLLCRRRELLERRTEYRQMEHDILAGADISNTIGNRRIERYDLSIDQIRKAIDAIDAELDEIDALLDGGAKRKAVAIVPRDW